MISRYFTHPPKTYKPVKSDPQRHLIYRLEKDIIGSAVGTTTDRKTLKEVLNHACRKYRVKVPRLLVVKDKDKAFGWIYEDDAVVLNKCWNGVNLSTLLHELAHWITDELNKDKKLQDHGPEFMLTYIELLDRYKMFPENCMRLLCEKYKVKIAKRNT